MTDTSCSRRSRDRSRDRKDKKDKKEKKRDKRTNEEMRGNRPEVLRLY
jgi:hypothetical protein